MTVTPHDRLRVALTDLDAAPAHGRHADPATLAVVEAARTAVEVSPVPAALATRLSDWLVDQRAGNEHSETAFALLRDLGPYVVTGGEFPGRTTDPNQGVDVTDVLAQPFRRLTRQGRPSAAAPIFAEVEHLLRRIDAGEVRIVTVEGPR